MSPTEELELEKLFKKAFEQPNLRPEFIEKLLNSNIYFPGQTIDENSIQLTEKILEENTPIHIISWPHEEYGRVIPFFTSLTEMKLAFDGNQTFLCMPCKIFMFMARDALLVLNPESEIKKSFTPEEIEELLLESSKSNQLEYPTGTQILLGQPEDYPEYMVEQLKKYFSKNVSVASAYLAQSYAETDQYAALLVGVQTDERLMDKIEQELNTSLSMIIKGTLQPIRPINLMIFDQSTPSSMILDYLRNETKPFYLKAKENKKGFFAKLFS